MDFIKQLLGDGFDPTALLPDLWAIFDKLDVALRVVVLAGGEIPWAQVRHHH